MKRLMGGLGLGVALVVAGSANALVIDTFDRTVSVTGDQRTGPSPAQTAFDLTGTPVEIAQQGPIGGFRTLSIVDGTQATNLTVLNGGLGFSAGPFSSGIGEVIWDANGAGLGGADLTVDNDDEEISIFLGFIDLGANFTLTVTLTDIRQNTASESGQVTDGVSELAFDLADFDPVDVTAVSRIVLRIEGEIGNDLVVIDSVAAGDPPIFDVPVPASLALLGLGLAAFGVARRRTR